jgi:hypothetical protein
MDFHSKSAGLAKRFSALGLKRQRSFKIKIAGFLEECLSFIHGIEAKICSQNVLSRIFMQNGPAKLASAALPPELAQKWKMPDGL